MIDWNEENFLEKLTPELLRKCGGATGHCPDAETLCAVIEGEARGPERDAIIEHLSQCAACADLRGRLLNFESVGPPDPEAVWNHTQIRLDNWLEGFLRSEGAHSGAAKGGKPYARVSGWESISNFFTSGKVIWALGVAGALVLIVAAPLLLEYRRARLPQVQVAARAPTPPKPPANAASVEKPPEKSTEKPKITPQEEALPKVGNNLPLRAESTIRPKPGGRMESAAAPAPAPADHNLPRQIEEATPPPPPNPALLSAPPDRNLPTETADATVPPATSNSERAPISSPPEPVQHPTGRLAPITPSSPSVRGERAAETAQTSGTASSVGPAAPHALSPRRAMSSGMTSLAISRTVAPASGARAERSPAISPPPVIRLDAGTRVWIALRSTRPLGDGVSEFRGLVLLPVTQSGAVLLSRNTEVSGTMTVRNGKRSLQILELLTAEAHYRLRSASGKANLRLLGAGGAVQFDAGQVLEMWLASASTYEKAPGMDLQPQQRK